MKFLIEITSTTAELDERWKMDAYEGQLFFRPQLAYTICIETLLLNGLKYKNYCRVFCNMIISLLPFIKKCLNIKVC